MPRALAIFDTSVGSMPRMRWPPFWKLEISVPSLEPISTTRSSLPSPSIFEELGIELGEIVAQELGHAAGVGIFRREDDDRIDREAELHQLAVAAIQQRRRKPGQLARHLADRRPSGSPAACSRATARSRACRARTPGRLRPERCPRCRRRGRLLLGTRECLLEPTGDAMDQALRRKAVRWPSTSPRSAAGPCASGTCGA